MEMCVSLFCISVFTIWKIPILNCITVNRYNESKSFSVDVSQYCESCLEESKSQAVLFGEFIGPWREGDRDWVFPDTQVDIISPGFFWLASWWRLILALSSSSFSVGVWQQKPSFQSRSSFLCDSFLLSWLLCPLTCFYSPVKVSANLRAELFPKQPWGSFLLLPVWKLSAHLFFGNACWFLWILPVPVPLSPVLWEDLES